MWKSHQTGLTWHPVSTTSANSSGSITGWTFNWSPALTGSYTLVSRAIDDSLNIGANSKAVAVTVTASPSVSLFAGATPRTISANDPNAIEVGVKFQSTQPGSIAALRFYKGRLNTGVHTAHLWTATGTLLASATFFIETASGCSKWPSSHRWPSPLGFSTSPPTTLRVITRPIATTSTLPPAPSVH